MNKQRIFLTTTIYFKMNSKLNKICNIFLHSRKKIRDLQNCVFWIFHEPREHTISSSTLSLWHIPLAFYPLFWILIINWWKPSFFRLECQKQKMTQLSTWNFQTETKQHTWVEGSTSFEIIKINNDWNFKRKYSIFS